MIVRRVQPHEGRELREWVIARHYLRSAPPGYAFILEFLCDYPCEERLGVMIFGRPASRAYDADAILEITRICFLKPFCGRDVQITKALAKARDYVRKWYPNVKLLLSYSDPAQGHDGTIYKADNWAPFGMTKKNHGYGWKSRPGRRSEECSRKQRWVRTP